MDNLLRTIRKRIKEIEKELSIPKGFFECLIKEDDWSLIIKLHSLIEAAVTHLIVKEIARPELEDVVANLALSDYRTGKMVFLRDLGLLNPYHKYVQQLSKIRNDFVHNISNVRLSLKEYLDNKPDQGKEFYKVIRDVHKKLGLKNSPQEANIMPETIIKHDLLLISLLMLSHIYKLTRQK